jgi:hypothetical protein
MPPGPMRFCTKCEGLLSYGLRSTFISWMHVLTGIGQDVSSASSLASHGRLQRATFKVTGRG